MAYNNAINLGITGVVTADGDGTFTASTGTDNRVIRWSTANDLQDTTISVSDAGEMTNASQPAFLAINSTSDTNQTGAGTGVTVEFDSERFDQNADYDATTDTFTAPVTGRYQFFSNISCSSITAAMTGSAHRHQTSNKAYNSGFNNPGAIRTSSDWTESSFSNLCDMDAADTCYVFLIISGGAGDTATINGGANPVTFFSGNLVC